MTNIKKNIFYISFIYALINLYVFYKKNELKYKNKNVDYLFLKFTKVIYKKFSSFLNKNNGWKINTLKKRKKIKINFVDYRPSGYQIPQINKIKRMLSEKFEIIIDNENPEYLFYNVFECFHYDIKYNKSIKIAYYTENNIPDLNDADYAIADPHIHYFDRYLKYSYIFGISHYFKNKERYNLIRQNIVNNSIKRKKFCGAVISNHAKYSSFRLHFIEQLNKYKNIDMGGKYNNNIGFVKNKILFLSQYKFSIAMENSEGSGYFSEKIVQSFLSGTIPIYYGDYLIDEYINPKAYIFIRNEFDISKKIRYIIKIDKDEKLYKKILSEKIFINQEEIIEKNEELRKEFLYNIFEQDYNKARRIDNYHYNILKSSYS